MSKRLLSINFLGLCAFFFLAFNLPLVFAQNPNNGWNLANTNDTTAFINDCTGAASQTDAAEPGDPGGNSCQSYDADLYESLQSNANGFEDSDIETYRVGLDADFFYFEIETVLGWNQTTIPVGASHHYILEIDIDFLTEANRPDFVFLYTPKIEHVQQTWEEGDKGGDETVNAFEDVDDDVGGDNPLDPDFPCAGCTGYEADFDTGDGADPSDVWKRIITRGGSQIIQIAIRRSTFTGTALQRIRSRAWSQQSSTFDKVDFPFHDRFEPANLPTKRVDNICGVDFSTCPETVPVTLAYFQATPKGSSVQLEWETATETANAGFNIYVDTPSGRQKLNQNLIPAQRTDSLVPKKYSFIVSAAQGDSFILEDVDFRGRSQTHGPFQAGSSHGRKVDAKSIDWASIKAEHDLKEFATRKAQKTQIDAQLSVTQAAKAPGGGKGGGGGGGGTPPPSYPSFEFLVQTEGLYRVTYEQLQAAGLDLAGVSVANIALTNRGNPVRIRVQGSTANTAVFGTGAFVEFYGQALNTLYTKTNVYLLRVDKSLALRVAIDKTAAKTSGIPSYYLETVTVNNNKAYESASPGAEPWYDTSMLAFTTPLSKTFSFEIDNLVTANVTSTLNVGLWGITDWTKGPDHHVRISLNGSQVSDQLFDGLVDHPVTANLASGVLKNGSNSLQLTLPGDSGNPYDLVYLDQYSVTYPRSFQAKNSSLTFAANANAFKVQGLANSSIVVYRIEGANVIQETALKIAQSGTTYSVTFRGTGVQAKYLVSTVSALKTPGIVPAQAFTDIKAGTAQYLVVTHPNFTQDIQPLVQARTNDGFSVKVVNVKDIYSQFGHGIFDPQAIRDYIAYAAANLGTQYVLLVGGDTYDYLNYLGLGTISFIPTPYTRTHDFVRFAPSDPLFVDTNNDRIPDLSIGRLPVRTSAEVNMVVDKILDYPFAGHSRTAIFASDTPKGLTSYRDETEGFIQKLPSGWLTQRAHIESLGLTQARNTLLTAMNQGYALTSFFGHSGPTVWTFQGLFSSSDATTLTNAGKPTVVLQWGCWNTYHVSPYYETLAHKFLLSGDRGAASVLGAAALTDARSERDLGRLIFGQLFQPGATIGSAIKAAKIELAASHPEYSDVILGWTLLGDPALRIDP